MWIRMAMAVGLALTGATQGAQVGAPVKIEELGFMTGCWEGAAGEGRIEERYTPAANVILGTTRYLRDGVVTGFEFTLIEERDGAVVLTPHPDGVRSEHGFRLQPDDDRAVFAAPEHDFPKRISYAPAGRDSLLVRIDGGEGSSEASEWRMGRMDCDRG
jgi:hypothetical protein